MNLELWRKTKKERGMTYEDISRISQIPLGTIKNIFAGYTPDPRESTVHAIEQALGVETNLQPVKNTSKNENQSIKKESPQNYGLSEDEQKLLERYRALSYPSKTRLSIYSEILSEEEAKNELTNKNKKVK